MFWDFGRDGGFGRFGASKSSLGGGGGGAITNITVVNVLNDTATATLAPAVTNGQNIPLDTAGWVLLIQCSGAQTIADATKLTINITRPGNTSGLGDAQTTRADVGYGTKVLRRAWSNQAVPLVAPANAFYVAIDNLVHATDVISSITLAAGFFTGQVSVIPVGSGLITNSSPLVYVKPFARFVDSPWRRFTTSAVVEFLCSSEFAAFGSQAARIEARGKINGSYGPWASSGGTMVRSVYTPSSGRNPSGVPAPVFRVTVDLSSLANSASRTDSMIVYRVYGWYGDVIFDSEIDGDALGATGTPISLNPPVGLPIIKDVVGNHTPIYAWINRDGTAGGSAAIQTGTSDPGAAASYSDESAALTAARAYNNSVARTTPHNDTSGIVILYRDVAGGALGNSNLAYWQRAVLTGFSDGLLPPVFASASYLATGTTTLNCRRRGVQDDGATAATSKFFTGVFEFRGLTFDATGLTGASHQITDCSGGAPGTAAAATNGMILIDCDIEENAAGGSSTPALSRPGWRWDTRVTHTNPTGATALGQTPATFSGMLLSIGCLYQSDAYRSNGAVAAAVAGTRYVNNYLKAQTAGLQPTIDYAIVANVRIDCDNPTNPMFTAVNSNGNRQMTKGFGACGVFVRKTGTQTGPAISISGDLVLTPCDNIVIHHIGSDAGDDNNNDRINWGYGDSAYIQILKRISLKFSGFGSANTKDDIFIGDGSTLPSNLAAAWATATYYSRGMMVHDANATPANRFFFQALKPFTSGAVQASDLADTTQWLACGQVNSVQPGSQPLRTGNWRLQHAVRCWGNVAARTANGDTGVSPGSWAGEVVSRGGQFPAVQANYWKTRTGGSISTLLNLGDYRPQSIAAGDANDSPLLARVPAGMAVSPFDLLGVARLNNGAGAGGPYERSA